MFLQRDFSRPIFGFSDTIGILPGWKKGDAGFLSTGNTRLQWKHCQILTREFYDKLTKHYSNSIHCHPIVIMAEEKVIIKEKKIEKHFIDAIVYL